MLQKKKKRDQGLSRGGNSIPWFPDPEGIPWSRRDTGAYDGARSPSLPPLLQNIWFKTYSRTFKIQCLSKEFPIRHFKILTVSKNQEYLIYRFEKQSVNAWLWFASSVGHLSCTWGRADGHCKISTVSKNQECLSSTQALLNPRCLVHDRFAHGLWAKRGLLSHAP